MRWSEDQLNEYLKRPGTRIAASFGAGLSVARAPVPTASPRKPKPEIPKELVESLIPEAPPRKPKSSARDRARRAAESVRTASVTGNFLLDESIEFQFSGARMLSTNDLYALSHFGRVGYRKAWHDAIEMAVLQVLGSPRGTATGWRPMSRFRITAHRQSTRLCDVEALPNHFKYAIDGLRYAGIIEDDDPSRFISIASTQSVGPHAVSLRIDAVGADEPAISTAGLTRQPLPRTSLG